MGFLDKIKEAAADAVEAGRGLVKDAVDAAVEAGTEALASIERSARQQAASAGEQVADAARQATEGADALDPNAIMTDAERAAGQASEQARIATAKAQEELRAAFGVRSAALAAKHEAAARETYAQLYVGNYSDPYYEGQVGDESTPNQHRLVNTYRLTRYLHWDPSNNDKADYPVVSVDLPFVQRITMQAQNAVARTRNIQGGVYAEHAGFMQRTFTIEGRSGPVWNVEQAPGGDQLLQRLGITRFTSLRNFLEAYGKENAENKNALVRFKDTRLVFTGTFESESHFCDVVNFNYRRSTDTSTYSFEYSLTLVTNGYATAQFQSRALLDVGSKETPRWLPDDLFMNPVYEFSTDLQYDIGIIWKDNFDALRSYRELVYGFAASLQAETPEFTAVNRLKNMRCSVLQDLRVATSVLSNAVDNSVWFLPDEVRARADAKTFLNFTSYGLDLAHILKGTAGTPCPVPPWSDLYYTIVPYVNVGAATTQFLIDLFGNNRGTAYTYSIINKQPVRPALQVNTNTSPERPFAAVNYFLPDNATDAYSIASFVFGDANLYWRIIDLNNFRDAYTRADGTPLSPGSSILVPSTTVPVARDQDVLGTDLLLVNGDLQLVGNNDVMRISGYANYTQNLMNRMKTPRGTNRVFPRYGLSAAIHARSDSTVPSMIRQDVTSQVMQDHRTDDVGNVALTELGDKVQVSMVVKAIAGPQRTFKFNYDLNSQVTA